MPVIGPWISTLQRRNQWSKFPGSKAYWEHRYVQGGFSGAGSYGQLAAFKADVINAFLVNFAISSVIEFGCGDGNQVGLIRYPSYTGVDVSQTAVKWCQQVFGEDPARKFVVAHPGSPYGTFELAISLDVIFHLTEDDIFESYMSDLFKAPKRFVIIYSSNGDPLPGAAWPPHVRHRRFTEWIERHKPDWPLLRKISNPYVYKRAGDREEGSFADFYFYRNSAGE